jgi:hypothetical protein
MAEWLRQSKRAHHALEKPASGNGPTEPLTLEPYIEFPHATSKVVSNSWGSVQIRGGSEPTAAPGQFLLKHLVLLAASLCLFGASMQEPWRKAKNPQGGGL